MKLGFNTYDNDINPDINNISVETAGSIVISFAERKDLSTVKHELQIPTSIVKAVYKDIIEIETMVSRIMSGTAILEFAELDESGEIVTPTIYNTVPTSQNELKSVAYSLIERDYSLKVQADYTIQDISDLKEKIDFCIDTLITYSKSDKTGDWEFFKDQFNDNQ